MTILITGGSGFIGAALARKLVHEGHSVRVFDSNFRGRARRIDDLLSEKKIEFVEGDIRDSSAVMSACSDCHTIIHLAYINGTSLFYQRPGEILEVAIRGVMNIFAACQKLNIRNLFLASSSEVYQQASVIPTPEEVPLIIPDVTNPRFSYGGGKILWELLGMHYATSDLDNVCIFRPHNVYGPDMGWNHVVPEMIVKAKRAHSANRDNFEILGDGTQKRAFIFIDDFVRAFMCIFDNCVGRQVVNIGTDSPIPMLNLANMIGERVSGGIVLRGQPAKDSAPAGETIVRCPDISKLREFGFEATVSLEEGLTATVSWYLENMQLLHERK